MKRLARRIAWRVSRRVYCQVRGEAAGDDIASNGEAYVQRCVIAATRRSGRLCALDVGANRGAWTLSLIAALPPELRGDGKTRVHAVEPIPAARARLMEALAAANASSLVEVHALALSDANGSGRMWIVGETSGRNGLVPNELSPTGALHVETVALGDFFARNAIERAELVKIDAEGHDLAIIEGARGFLADGRIDVLQFEYNHTWIFARAFLKDVFDRVAGLPYVVARVRPSTIEIIDGWHPEVERFFHANYLLVRKPALDWFGARRGHFDGSNTYA